MFDIGADHPKAQRASSSFFFFCFLLLRCFGSVLHTRPFVPFRLIGRRTVRVFLFLSLFPNFCGNVSLLPPISQISHQVGPSEPVASAPSISLLQGAFPRQRPRFFAVCLRKPPRRFKMPTFNTLPSFPPSPPPFVIPPLAFESSLKALSAPRFSLPSC